MRISGFLRRIPFLERFLPEMTSSEKLSRACLLMGGEFRWKTLEIYRILVYETVVWDGEREVFRRRATSEEVSKTLVLGNIMEDLGPEVSFRAGLARRFSPGKRLFSETELLRRTLESLEGKKMKAFFGKSLGEILVWISSGERWLFFSGWKMEEFLCASIKSKRKDLTGCETEEETLLWLESRGR
jgi:hypothetical protein